MPVSPVPWKPIVVGVDNSTQAARAAIVGQQIARVAETQCHLVHATDDEIPTRDFDETLHLEHVRAQLPPASRAHVELFYGKARDVLVALCRTRQAGLLIVGGKHHAAPVRWVGGSTAHHVLQTTDIPVLVLGSAQPDFERLLVAVDDSYALGPTLEMARRLVQLFGGEIRVVHASRFPPVTFRGLARKVQRILNSHAELEVVDGTPNAIIDDIATTWKADVVVVGSHGKGWIDRTLLGSTTIALLNKLPTSLLVVPVRVSKAGTTSLLGETPELHPKR